MKQFNPIFLPIGAVVSAAAISIGVAFGAQAPASAQAAYGSYVGIGPSFGLTRGEDNDREISAVVSGRYKFLTAPISVRAQALIGSGVAIVPTISYDIPINWQTDAYIGAGASIPIGGGDTPVGNQTSFAIQPGIDYALPNSNIVVFGNAIISFYSNNRGGAAASHQGGVGLRF